jgi:WD40 repeat protein
MQTFWKTGLTILLATLFAMLASATGLPFSQNGEQAAAAISFSPDGRLLAAVDWRNGVTVWDLKSGEPRRLTAGSQVNALAFHPNSRWLAAVGQNNTVELLDVTGSELRILRGHTADVRAVVFVGQGNQVASASHDGTLKLWEFKTGRELSSFPLGPLEDAAFSPDGALLATRSGDSRDTTTRLWNVADGRLLRSFPGSAGGTMAFSPDGKLLAEALGGRVGIFEAATGREAYSLVPADGLSTLFSPLAFSTDGRWLAAGRDHVRFWEVKTGRDALRLHLAVDGGERALAFSPDNQWFASTAEAGIRLCAIALQPEQHGHRTARACGRSSLLAFRTDGRMIATGDDHGTVGLWDLTTGQMVQTLEVPWGPITGLELSPLGLGPGLALSPDAKLVAAVDYGTGMVRLWDADTGEEVRRLGKNLGSVGGALAFSPDGRLLAVGGFQEALLFEVDTGRQVLTLITSTEPVRDTSHISEWAAFDKLNGYVNHLAFNKDGSRLALASLHSLQVWNSITGQQLANISTPGEEAFSSLAFSPDGHWLAAMKMGFAESAGVRYQLVLYDSATLREVRNLPQSELSPFSFSPDGRLLTLAGNAVTIWDPATGQLLRTMNFSMETTGDETFKAVTKTFSSNGKWLAVTRVGAKGETSIDLWEVSTGKHVATLAAGLPVRLLRWPGTAPAARQTPQSTEPARQP